MTATDTSANAIATIIDPSRRPGVGRLRREIARATDSSPFAVHLRPIGTRIAPSLFYVQIPEDIGAIAASDLSSMSARVTPIGNEIAAKDICAVEDLLEHAVEQVRLAVQTSRPMPIRLGRPLFIAATIGAGSTSLDTLTREEWQVYYFKDDKDRRRSYSLFQFGQKWLSDVSLSLGWPVHEGSPNVLQTVLGEAMVR